MDELERLIREDTEIVRIRQIGRDSIRGGRVVEIPNGADIARVRGGDVRFYIINENNGKWIPKHQRVTVGEGGYIVLDGRVRVQFPGYRECWGVDDHGRQSLQSIDYGEPHLFSETNGF